MNTYIGSKLVKAMPMTKEAYGHFRGNPPPEDDWEDEPGYLLEDPKGIANTLSYSGLISWMPAMHFESEYINMGDLTGIPDYQQRLLGELAQLQERLSTLLLFTKSDKLYKLNQRNRDLLLEQARVMTQYLFILEDRLKT